MPLASRAGESARRQCAAAVWLCALGVGSADAVGPRMAADEDAVLVQEVNAALRLLDSTIVTLDLDAQAGQPMSVLVPLDGAPLLLELHAHSVRAATYQVLAQIEDGAPVRVAPGPERTLRGSVAGVPGSAVAASLLPDGLHARIAMPDGTQYWLEPLGSRVPGALPQQHVVYREADVGNSGDGACDVDALMPIPSSASRWPFNSEHDAPGAARCVAELALDADYQYFQRYGSVAAVEDRINAIVNAVNLQYERDVGITHQISAIVVRTAEPDPYDDTIYAGVLLDQFQQHWLVNHADLPRDVAQLLTGRTLDRVIGAAMMVGGVCTDAGFSVVRSDWSPLFASVTDLHAHELGHSWGADHSPDPTCTMYPAIMGTNRFQPVDDIPDIVAYRDSRDCLDACHHGPPPAALTGLSVTVGTRTGGSLPELAAPDDQYVRVAAARQGSYYRSQVIVTALSPSTSASGLDLRIESGVDAGGVRATVSLLAWSTNAWVSLATYDESQADSERAFLSVSNPGRYVSSTGEIRVRIATEARRTQTPNGYAHRLDRLQINVAP